MILKFVKSGLPLNLISAYARSYKYPKRSVHVESSVYSDLYFHSTKLTHPLSLDFTRWPSLGPAQLPGEARLEKTESGEARFRKPQSQPLSSHMQVFMVLAVKAQEKAVKQ